jgi:signal transduction histidine kinase
MGLAPLWAQGPGRLPERLFGDEHGLISLATYALVQDQQGFLWVGTEGGVHRFDGHRWELLDLDLPTSWVESLYPDSRGRLWIGCRKGLAVLEQGQARKVAEVETRVTHLGEDREGRIWALGSGGAQVLEAGTWKSVRKVEGRDQPTAMYVHRESSTVWLVGGRTVWSGNGRDPWTLDQLPLNVTRESLVGVAVDGTGLLWARTNLRVWFRPVGQTGTWQSRLSPDTGQSPDNPCVIRDPEGGVWITTLRGPIRFRGTTMEAYTQGAQFPSPTALLVDREGGLWVGTGGIHQVLGRGQWRTHGLTEGLPSMVVWNLLRDGRGRLWAASEGGLCVATQGGWRVVKRGFFTRLVLGPGGLIYATGHPGGVVYRLHPESERVETLRVDCLQSGPELRGLGVDATGRLFVSNMQDGVAMGTPQGDRLVWSPVALPEGKPQEVWHLLQDPWHRIFLASSRSLHVWEGSWAPVEGVLDLNPYGVLALDADRILVTYFKKPTLTIHRKGADGWHLESTLEPLKGVPNLIIYASRLAGDRMLWLATNQGLIRVPDQGRGTAEWFRPREGMPGADPTYDGLLLDPDGSVWVGTTQGLGHLAASGHRTPPSLPLPQVTAIRSQGQPLDPAQPLRIRRGESLEVAYAVNSWLRPASVRYESRILGLEKAWVGSDEPRLRYPSLTAGHHILAIRATLRGGGTSPTLELAFEVLPAWWESTAARIAYGVGLIGLILGLIHLRQRHLRQRNRLLLEQVAARTAELELANQSLELERRRSDSASKAKSAFLAGMSHELRTPLNAMLLYSELLAEDAEARQDKGTLTDLIKIRGAGQHLLSMINGVLDLSKIEAGKMELALEEVMAEGILVEVRDTLLAQAQQRGNEFIMELGEGLQPLQTDATKLRQVLLNLAGNACKFTSNGRVTLSLHGRPEGAVFGVQDTGVGMTPEQTARAFNAYEQAEETTSTRYGGTGLGLSLCKGLVEMLGGSITLESTAGVGTTVTVRLPWVHPGTR